MPNSRRERTRDQAKAKENLGGTGLAGCHQFRVRAVGVPLSWEDGKAVAGAKDYPRVQEISDLYPNGILVFAPAMRGERSEHRVAFQDLTEPAVPTGAHRPPPCTEPTSRLTVQS